MTSEITSGLGATLIQAYTDGSNARAYDVSRESVPTNLGSDLRFLWTCGWDAKDLLLRVKVLEAKK